MPETKTFIVTIPMSIGADSNATVIADTLRECLPYSFYAYPGHITVREFDPQDYVVRVNVT